MYGYSNNPFNPIKGMKFKSENCKERIKNGELVTEYWVITRIIREPKNYFKRIGYVLEFNGFDHGNKPVKKVSEEKFWELVENNALNWV